MGHLLGGRCPTAILLFGTLNRLCYSMEYESPALTGGVPGCPGE